jgi:hypothetical protein
VTISSTSFSADSIGAFLKDVRDTATQLSGTGVAVIQARQQVRNAQADARNTDAWNVAITSQAVPTAGSEVMRARRDALTAGLTTGAAAPLGSGSAMPVWLLVAMAAAVYLMVR